MSLCAVLFSYGDTEVTAERNHLFKIGYFYGMRITQLLLYTNNLAAQVDFYRRVLQLHPIASTDTSVEYKVGSTQLIFRYRDNASPYHFAINIPANKAPEALRWLKERVEILPFEKHELIDFENWNALSMYFYDADKNIVELIARKNLHTESTVPFGSEQFLCISEIGLGTDGVEPVYNQLNALKALPIYDGSFDRFCAAGDEQGLFIIVDRNKKKWFPTDDIIHLSDLIITGDYNFEFTKGKISDLTTKY